MLRFINHYSAEFYFEGHIFALAFVGTFVVIELPGVGSGAYILEDLVVSLASSEVVQGSGFIVDVANMVLDSWI